MKTLFLTFLTMGVFLSALADDDQGLTADATVDQVTDAVDKQIDNILRKNPDRYQNTSSGLDQRDRSDATTKFGAVGTQAVLDALGQAKTYGRDYDVRTYLRREILFYVLVDKVRDSDLPNLLACQAAEALWVVCLHPGWYESQALTSYLADQLKNLPSDDAEDTPEWVLNQYFYGEQAVSSSSYWSPCRTWQWSLLYLASVSNNANVHEQLVAAIQRAVSSTDAKPVFLSDALLVVSNSRSQDLGQFASPLMERILSANNISGMRVSDCVEDVVRTHPDLLKDPDFDKNANLFAKTYDNRIDYYKNVLLARIGDSMSFVDVMGDYYNPTYMPYPYGDDSTQQSMKRQFNQDVDRMIIGLIEYNGDGNRDDGIKEGFHNAQFKDGHWIIGQASSPTQAPVALASPTPPPAKLAALAASTKKLDAAIDKAVAAIPHPVAATPTRVAVAARAPIESLDATGQVTGVNMATVGAAYDVVRVDGDSFIVKDVAGNQYRIAAQAVQPVATTAPAAN